LTVTGETKEEHDANLKRLLDAAADCNLTLNEDKSKICVTSLRKFGYLISYQNLKPDPDRLQALFDLSIPSSSKELKRVCGMFAYYARWIHALLQASNFPIGPEDERSFKDLKIDLGRASLGSIREGVPFEIETDSSDNVLAAVLSQGGRPVAFMSRTLSHCEKRYPAIEKEATPVIEAVRKWQHFIMGRFFTIVTDQEAVSFMFNQRHHGKTKNTKILCWRLELGHYNFDIRHKPGVQNVAPDTFSQMCNAAPGISLLELHQSLGHPGYTRFYHFIRQHNLPFSGKDAKAVCKNCHTCAEVKPQFFKPDLQTLIKAVRPWDRISVDFKSPVSGHHPYLLIVVDEHSHFPFVFPCKNMRHLL